VFVDQMNALAIEIRAVQRLSEMEVHAGRFGGIQQQHVECATRDRPDHFAVVHAIALQSGAAVARVHHAAAHHHRALQHVVGEAGFAQRLQAAFGQREIDRAAAHEAGDARVSAFFEDVDGETASRQLLGQQGADQAAADKSELLRHGVPL